MHRSFVFRVLWSLALFLVCSCAYFQAPDSPQAEAFECRVAALEPLVGEVFEAEDLVRDIYAGQANLMQVIVALGATRAEVEELARRLDACSTAEALASEPPVLPTGIDA